MSVENKSYPPWVAASVPGLRKTTHNCLKTKGTHYGLCPTAHTLQTPACVLDPKSPAIRVGIVPLFYRPPPALLSPSIYLPPRSPLASPLPGTSRAISASPFPPFCLNPRYMFVVRARTHARPAKPAKSFCVLFSLDRLWWVGERADGLPSPFHFPFSSARRKVVVTSSLARTPHPQTPKAACLLS